MYLVRTTDDQCQNSPSDPAGSEELADRRRRFQLARVLKVTGEMIDHANEGCWQQVEALELLRRMELEACFSLQGSTPSPLVAEAMATLMYLNDRLVQVVRHARGQLRDSHGAQSKAFTAVKVYEEMR